MALRRSPCVAWQRVGDEAVLVDLESGVSYGLNGTASLIWERLEDGIDVLEAELTVRFDIDRERAASDISRFVELMKGKALIRAESE